MRHLFSDKFQSLPAKIFINHFLPLLGMKKSRVKHRKGMKALKPSLREKKRYLVYDVYPKQGLVDKSVEAVKHLIVQELKKTLGVWHSAQAGIIHLDFSKKLGRGILRVSLKSLNIVRASFAITEFEGLKATVIGVSGILKKARQRYFA